MGFHGFRSGSASFGSVAPLVYPTGTATLSGASAFVVLAASVSLLAGDVSTAAVAASTASFSGGASVSALSASVSKPTPSATLAASSAISLGAVAGAGSLAGRTASVSLVDGDAALVAPLVRTAAFTGSASLPAYSASIAPRTGGATLAASSALSPAPIAGTATFAGLSASVSPLTGAASFVVLYPAKSAFSGAGTLTAIRASVGTFTADASLNAVRYTATTLTTLGVAWTASTDLFNVSRYTNFPFNSIATVDGYRVGLTSVGAYILTGDDDAGTAIDASIKTDFSDAVDGKQGLQPTPQLRSPNSMYLPYSGGPMTVTLSVSNSRGVARQDYVYDVPEGGADVATWRTLFGRGLRYRYSQVTLANVSGSDFTLQDPQMTVDLSQRRI